MFILFLLINSMLVKHVPKATAESGTTPETNAAKYHQISDQVETWCADVSEITRKTVALLADELKDSKDNAPNRKDDGQNSAGSPGAGGAGEFVHEQIAGGAGDGQCNGEGGKKASQQEDRRWPCYRFPFKSLAVFDDRVRFAACKAAESDGCFRPEPLAR